MIKSIGIENFKCFGSTPPAVLDCAPITLLYGPNSAGKSTITQALRLMQAQFAEDSPGPNPFQYKHWNNKAGYAWMAPYESMRYRHAEPADPLVLTCTFAAHGTIKKNAFVRMRYASTSGILERMELGHDDVVRFALVPNDKDLNATRTTSSSFIFQTASDHIGSYTLWRLQEDKDITRKELDRWGKRLQEFFREDLMHAGPHRPAPLRKYLFRGAGANLNSSLATMGTQDVDLLLKGRNVSVGDSDDDYAEWLCNHLKNTDELTSVNAWLSRLGVGVSVELQKESDGCGVLLKPDGSEKCIALPDVGYGVSQILPIIVLAVAEQNRIIIIEQPELHIHPKLQAELGDLFLESADKRGNQFIVETHSEHLCLRLLRRIRESPATSSVLTDVAVRYVYPRASGAQVLNMRISRTGTFLDSWPGGFFPERMKELLGA